MEPVPAQRRLHVLDPSPSQADRGVGCSASSRGVRVDRAVGQESRAIADEVMAFVPETIVQIDADFRIRAVNRTGSPIFRRIPSPGDRLDEVFRGRVVGVIARLIDKAQRTGVAEAEADTGAQLFWVSAKRLESAPLTVVVIQDRTSQKHSSSRSRPGSGPEQLPGGEVGRV